MNRLKSFILFLTIPAIELTKNDNWKFSSFFGFFFGLLSFLVLIGYPNIWGRLLTLLFAYFSGICLGATAMILDRFIDED